MILERIPAITELSQSDKFTLVSELWEDISAHPDGIPVSQGTLDELDTRLEHYKNDPENTTTWEDIKRRISNSR